MNNPEFIYIRHIWIKPVLCSRMVSLFHHKSPWTHRCLQSSRSAHRNGRVFRRSVQTACCYWIIPPTEIHRRMQAVYGDRCVDVSTVGQWVKRFKDGEMGQADLSDKTRSWRPVTDSKNFIFILWNNQQMSQCAVKFISLQVHSTCFGRHTRPSSGVQS